MCSVISHQSLKQDVPVCSLYYEKDMDVKLFLKKAVLKNVTQTYCYLVTFWKGDWLSKV